MEKNKSDKEQDSKTAPEVRVVTLNPAGKNMITMIDAKAAAGLPTRLDDPQFYEDLPAFTLPGPQFNQGHQICIQIEGDSMHPTIGHGDWIICRELENNEPIRNGFVYIVVTTTSAVCKRISYTKGCNYLEASSDNKLYSPYHIPLGDVLRLYQAVANISTSFRNPNDGLEMRLEAVESLVNTLQKKVGE